MGMSELLQGTNLDEEQAEYNHFVTLSAGSMLQVCVCTRCPVTLVFHHVTQRQPYGVFVRPLCSPVSCRLRL